MSEGYKIETIWEAVIFSYLGFPLLRVEFQDQDKRLADWYFDVPSAEAEGYIAEYHSSQGLAIAHAKRYGMAFAKLNKFQNDLRHSDEQVWIAPPPEMTPERWNAIQQQGEKITQMREAFERKKNVAA